MRALIQRVSQAEVIVDEQSVGKIGAGLLVLLGAEKGDTIEIAKKLAERISNYRVFSDEKGHMNLNIKQAHGSILVVSQFTLAANTNKGLRPSFDSACPPELAKPLVETFTQHLTQFVPTESGIFGADMQVALINDGPVTFLLNVN